MKKALLVGINRFTRQKQLRGCVRDVIELADLLDGQYSFDDVEIITNSALASKTQLTEAISRLMQPEEGEADGVRVFFFAGHGGRVLDSDDGDENDGVDENICLPDYWWNDNDTYIIDDDLGSLLDPVSEPDILRRYVIFDSCHSGTATRETIDGPQTWEEIETSGDPLNFGISIGPDFQLIGQAVNYKCVAREAADPPDLPESITDISQIGGGGGSPTSHLLFSGCRDNQSCKDVPVDGRYHGIFTKYLTTVIKEQPEITWADLHSLVSSRLELTQFMQNPQLEGPADLINRPVFS